MGWAGLVSVATGPGGLGGLGGGVRAWESEIGLEEPPRGSHRLCSASKTPARGAVDGLCGSRVLWVGLWLLRLKPVFSDEQASGSLP